MLETTWGAPRPYDRFMPIDDIASSGPALEDLSDENLLEAFRTEPDSDRADQLFSELFRRYQGKVRGWCTRLVGDRDRATDLTQEIFLKAFRHSGSYRGQSRFSTWLYAITRNHCLNSRKKRESEPRELTDVSTVQLEDSTIADPCIKMERDQSVQKLWRLIEATLSVTEARVVALHYAHEVPLRAITIHLGLSNPSGAKAYIVNARRKLSGMLHRPLRAV
jgi:RNA polymerase sigma factor (sigma-70 family)